MAGTWPQFLGRRRRLPALCGTRDRPARGDAAERAAGGWGAAPAQDADPAFLLSPGADLSLLQEDLPEDADGREWLTGGRVARQPRGRASGLGTQDARVARLRPPPASSLGPWGGCWGSRSRWGGGRRGTWVCFS